MKKNILVQVGEREEQRTRHIPATYGENGEILTPEFVETYTVTVPIMEAKNVEMTAEEITELESIQASAPKPEQSAAERVAALETQVAALTALLAQKGET